MATCMLFRGHSDSSGNAVYRDTGTVSDEKEADATCRAKAKEFTEGRPTSVIYPLGPRGSRKFGQPQLPLPAGNTYLVTDVGNAGPCTLFGWRRIG
jgi:hypothetical protein